MQYKKYKLKYVLKNKITSNPSNNVKLKYLGRKKRNHQKQFLNNFVNRMTYKIEFNKNKNLTKINKNLAIEITSLTFTVSL